MNAVILAIGDELVLGQNVDTNSAWLSARLARRGVMTLYHETVADDLAAIKNCVRRAAGAAELVIVTGGLGPTLDDLTREALAGVLGVPLELHAPSLRRIEGFFLKIGRPMAESNRAQALVPHGAEMLANDWGTAPGLLAKFGTARIYVFPGVPHEMMPMFERYVEPDLVACCGRTILTEALRTFGAGESSLAEKLGELMRRDRNPTVGTTASGGIVTVRVRSDFPDQAEAEREMAETVAEVEKRLGRLIFGRGAVSLAQVVVTLLQRQGKTLATVEDATGGLVAGMITERGVSITGHVFRGGWIVGAGDGVDKELGVGPELTQTYGAASEEVTAAMAGQALARSGADFGLAVGELRESGDVSQGNRAGSAWVALARRNGPVVEADLSSFPGDLEIVRDRLAKAALNMMRVTLEA